MTNDPFGDAAKWARAAGYSDHKEGAKVRGFEALHNPKVEAAALELGRQMLSTAGPVVAAAALLRAARNPNHPQHIKAAELIANRVGLHEVRELRVQKVEEPVEVKAEKIKALARMLRIDPATLLGGEPEPEMKLIEGKAE
jgi:phage terminase small subunit